MERSETAITERRVDEAFDSHTRDVLRRPRRKYDVKRTRDRATTEEANSDVESIPVPSEADKGGATRKRRGIRPKNTLSGARPVKARTQPRRQTPGPQPNRADISDTSRITPSQEPFQQPAEAPPLRPASPETGKTSPPTSVKPQRRLVMAVALSFVAGSLFTYWLSAPEDTPAPKKAAPTAKEETAVKRDLTRTRTTRQRVSEGTRPAPPPMTDTLHAPTSPMVDTYRPMGDYASETTGAYPGTGYGASLPGYHYPPAPVEESHGADTWPSANSRSVQRTFRQPFTVQAPGSERPWGRVDNASKGRRTQPEAQYPGYAPPGQPYGVPGAYPGGTVGLPGQEQATEFYPPWGSP